MNYSDFYKLVSWLVKQEAESSEYSLGTIEDLLPITNLKMKSIVMAYPAKFRGLYRHQVADATGLIRVPLAVRVYAVKLGNTNWTVPMSYNSPHGTIFMEAADTIRIIPTPALGSTVMFDCALKPTPLIDETSPLDMPEDALEVVRYQVAEEIFIRSNTTPSESFYRAMSSAISLFANRAPIFTQQAVMQQGPVFGGRS